MIPFDLGPSVADALRLGARAYQDREGHHWTVFEWPAVPDQGMPPTLIFESSLVVRRVRNYPADWRAIDRAALEQLSWQR